MLKLLPCLFFILLASPCRAQLCMPTKAGPQSESGYSYVRTEIIVLGWIRTALTESDKFQWVSPDDPERIHKSIELYSVLNNVSDDYDCAVSLLTPFKDSKNESIHTSVDSLLLAIQSTKQINTMLMGMMESLNKATKAEDIDQPEIAKTLADIKSMQKYVRTLTMAGVKMSTFGILHMDGTGDDVKPTAFIITGAERETLLSETREPAKKKGKEETYVDVCAEILLTTLNSKLPSAA